MQFASWSLVDIFHAKPAAESLIPLIDQNIDDDGILNDEESNKGIEKEIDGKIEVKHVNFAYPARPDLKVANGLTLRADVKNTIALVGPSGGGKSTIIQLLERFYQPQSGNIVSSRFEAVFDLRCPAFRRSTTSTLDYLIFETFEIKWLWLVKSPSFFRVR